MTLLDLANFVCTKVNQTDDTDLAACKGFLLRRRDLIWADALWKDSLFEYTQTITSVGYTPSSTWMPTKKTLLLPAQIEYPVALRTDTRKLDVESSERLYRIDADTFSQSGQSTQYRLLSPVVWEFDTPQAVYVVPYQPADAGESVSVTGLASDGITVSTSPTILTAAAQSVGTLGRIDAVTKAQTEATVNVFTPSGSISVVNNSSVSAFFLLSPDGNLLNLDQTTALVPPGGSVTINPDGWIASSDQPGPLWPSVQILAGPLFRGTITYAGNGQFTFAQQSIVALQATDTVAIKRCRVQLLGVINDNTVLRVLGKAKASPFTADTDEPGLTGIENCLIAFAQADMLERERQYGKAQAVKTEAVQLLDQLKRIQTTQQSHHKRFIPQEGYGPDYQIYNSPLTF